MTDKIWYLILGILLAGFGGYVASDLTLKELILSSVVITSIALGVKCIDKSEIFKRNSSN